MALRNDQFQKKFSDSTSAPTGRYIVAQGKPLALSDRRESNGEAQPWERVKFRVQKAASFRAQPRNLFNQPAKRLNHCVPLNLCSFVPLPTHIVKKALKYWIFADKVVISP